MGVDLLGISFVSLRRRYGDGDGDVGVVLISGPAVLMSEPAVLMSGPADISLDPTVFLIVVGVQAKCGCLGKGALFNC